MKKITMLVFILLFTGNTYAIREYKSLPKVHKRIYDSLIATNKNLNDFKKTISFSYNYRLTNIANQNIAEKILNEKEFQNKKEWFFVIFIYSILNEIEEQLESNKGKKLERFKKVLTRAHLKISETENLEFEELEKILYETSKGKESFFKIYMSNLILDNKIITPSLISSLDWLHLELINSIEQFNIENIIEILEIAPYLVLRKINKIDIKRYIENLPETTEDIPALKDNLISMTRKIEESLESFRANIKYTYCNIF